MTYYSYDYVVGLGRMGMSNCPWCGGELTCGNGCQETYERYAPENEVEPVPEEPPLPEEPADYDDDYGDVDDFWDDGEDDDMRDDD